MSGERKNTEILARASTATTQRTTIALDQLEFDMERFCHRPAEALSEENLASLMESLTLEGLQVPIEFYRDREGRYILTKGHRRVTACRYLADRNVPGFTRDMQVEAVEVSGDFQDLLVRSVADNEVRLNLDRIARIRVAKKLHDAGVQVERAARAVGVSVKTYERDLLIARHDWMFAHVIGDRIQPTHAVMLLMEATRHGRIEELKQDLDIWIDAKNRQIREKERFRRVKDGKGLSPAEKQVKNLLPKHLVVHWIALLRDKQRFDHEAQWHFAAGIDKDSGQLRISSLNLNLTKTPMDSLAKVGSKLSLLTKQLARCIKERVEQENNAAPSENDEMPYDLDFFRDVGLEDYGADLEQQLRLTEEEYYRDADTIRDQIVEREESDITTDAKLPHTPAPEQVPDDRPTNAEGDKDV